MSFFRLEKEREQHLAQVASVLQNKPAGTEPERLQKFGNGENLEQKLYSGIVVSKQRHLLEVRIDDEDELVVSVPRKWVRLGFGAYDILKRGDKVTVKYLGFDKIIRKDIFLVVASKSWTGDGSEIRTSFESNQSLANSFSHLLNRDTWKEEK